jgi:hypothetical protein
MNDPLLERLDRIEAKLDIVLNGKPPEIVNIHQALDLTGCNSISSQYRWFAEHGVAPYLRGKYRRLEITNKVAALRLARSAKLMAAAKKAEAEIADIRPD